MLCNVHQLLRCLAKSIPAVTGGGATAVDKYQKPEVGLSTALDTGTSPKLAKLPHTNAEQPWPPAEWAWRVGQARIRSGKMTQNNLLHLLWTWQWSPDVPSLEFPSQFRPNFVRHAKSDFGALGCLIHRKAKEMWLWCQKPQKCSLKCLFFSLECPSSREHIVF